MAVFKTAFFVFFLSKFRKRDYTFIKLFLHTFSGTLNSAMNCMYPEMFLQWPWPRAVWPRGLIIQ